MIKCWHISDTHTYHNLLNVPEVDVVIHSGDATNQFATYRNEQEMYDFFYWYSNLPIKYKIYIAGNHDTSIERGIVTKKDFTINGIHYLQDELLTLEGLRIYGSPWTPTFGDWAFMRKRGKLAPIWKNIPEELDILVTHGPGYGVLDLSENRDGTLDMCGDKELLNEIYMKQPKYHCFGHIHNRNYCINQGTRTITDVPTIFMNSSVVEDGKFGALTNHGTIFEI